MTQAAGSLLCTALIGVSCLRLVADLAFHTSGLHVSNIYILCICHLFKSSSLQGFDQYVVPVPQQGLYQHVAPEADPLLLI